MSQYSKFEVKEYLFSEVIIRHVEGAEFKMWVKKMLNIIWNHYSYDEFDGYLETSFGMSNSSSKFKALDEMYNLIQKMYMDNRFIQFVSPTVSK